MSFYFGSRQRPTKVGTRRDVAAGVAQNNVRIVRQGFSGCTRHKTNGEDVMAAQEEFSLSQEDFVAKAATKSYLAKPGRNPFRIDEPTVISFSGGRTSAYMLWRVLEAKGGLPEDAIVCFANTGKEEEATLEFVRDCEVNWGVEIHWLEYRPEKQVARTNFEIASRNGEPFETIIKERKMLPNTRARFCTVELKIRTLRRYLQSIGWDEWLNMIGIRHDEQRRVVKMQPDSKVETPIMPLADAGVTKADVLGFWASQPFDLKLPVINGETIGRKRRQAGMATGLGLTGQGMRTSTSL